MNKILAALAIVFALASCSNNGKTSIEGSVDIEGVDKVYLAMFTTTGIKELDTATVADGKFSFPIEKDTAKFYLLTTSDQYRIPLYMQPGEQMEITLTGQEVQDRMYEIKGSPESEHILNINKITVDVTLKRDSLNKFLGDPSNTMSPDEKRNAAQNGHAKIINDATQRFKAMIDEDPGRMGNIHIFSQAAGPRESFLNVQRDFEYFERVANAVKERYVGDQFAEAFADQVQSVKEQLAAQAEMEKTRQRIVPGSEVPEIAMPDPDGNERKLSDLKGSVVLVDFWAYWCKPCRLENPNLVRMYNDYKDKGFTVFSVSLDGLPQQPNAKQDWISAIEQDGLAWDNHVSDLKGWDSDAVNKFGFSGIPYTVLVDREGKVVATGLRGPALEEKIKEVL